MKCCKKIIFLLFVIVNTQVYAQVVSFQWEREVNGGATDDLSSMVVDAVGNVYTTGGFYGQVDFDPGPGTLLLGTPGSTYYTMFVYKLNALGNLVWARAFFGTGAAYPKSLKLDSSGNLLVTGNFGGEVDFDPVSTYFNVTAIGSNDAFVLKLNASGLLVWVKNMGGASSGAISNSIDLDVLDNFYISGYFVGTVDFDPASGISNHTSTGSYDIFVSKFDSGGNFLWAVDMGGSAGADYGYSLMVSDTGNIYLTGRYENTVDMDPGAGVLNFTSMGQSDVFIEKFDSSGNMIWAKSMGGSGYDYCRSIVIDTSENLYITGFYNGSVDFDPSVAGVNIITSPTSSDNIFECKYNSSGDLQWVANMGGIAGDVGQAVTIDSMGNVYSVGYYQFNADFDPSPTVYDLSGLGYMKTYISKLDNNRNFLWAHELSGTNSSSTVVGYSISVGVTGDIYVSGSYSATIDFDPGPTVYNKTAVGSSDCFILKLSQSIFTGDTEASLLGDKKILMYPNPADSFIDIETDLSNYSISVFDNIGKLIFKENECKSKKRIDISNLPSGLYIVQLLSDGELINKKFIKQ